MSAAPYQPTCAEAPDAANTAAKAAPARSLNFIIRALSLPLALRPIDPAFLIARPGDYVSVTEATLEPQSHGPANLDQTLYNYRVADQRRAESSGRRTRCGLSRGTPSAARSQAAPDRPGDGRSDVKPPGTPFKRLVNLLKNRAGPRTRARHVGLAPSAVASSAEQRNPHPPCLPAPHTRTATTATATLGSHQKRWTDQILAPSGRRSGSAAGPAIRPPGA